MTTYTPEKKKLPIKEKRRILANSLAKICHELVLVGLHQTFGEIAKHMLKLGAKP